jgi:hypothetical protein
MAGCKGVDCDAGNGVGEEDGAWAEVRPMNSVPQSTAMPQGTNKIEAIFIHSHLIQSHPIDSLARAFFSLLIRVYPRSSAVRF